VIDYDGRVFRAIANSANGESGSETLFHYRQHGAVVWADYAGGGIRNGHLIAAVDGEGGLDMRYHHVSRSGALMTGRCRSRLEILADGRYRLHERWQWTGERADAGESVVEEIAASSAQRPDL
jgi:hypothetical protein